MDQKIQIENNKKQKLIGLLSELSHDTLVILCHGFTATKNKAGFNYLTGDLANKDISTFRFDFSGSGESEGSKTLSLKQQVDDLSAVINYFKTYKHIYLLGHSLGILSALICSKLPEVTGIISINGFFQGKIYRSDFNRAYQTLRVLRFFVPRIHDEWEHMIINVKPEKIAKPMLIITTENDNVLDYRQSINFGNSLTHNHCVETLRLSGHSIDIAKDGEIIAKLISQWIA
jgi:esterase/lipase